LSIFCIFEFELERNELMEKIKKHLFKIDTALLAKRIVVRRFRENEGAKFQQLVQDNSTMIHDILPVTVEACRTKAGAEYFIRKKMAAWLLNEEYCFGIWDNESAEMIGFIEIIKIDWRIPKGELAFFIDKDFKEKGLMTEAMKEVIDFAFKQLKMEKLALRTAMDNYAAQRLAKKCGFYREGDLRNEFRNASGALIDAMIFGLPHLE